MKKKLPLESSLCPETIKVIIMTHRVVEVLQDDDTNPAVKELAKTGLQVIVEQHASGNPTYN
jgi:hypothetical protein